MRTKQKRTTQYTWPWLCQLAWPSSQVGGGGREGGGGGGGGGGREGREGGRGGAGGREGMSVGGWYESRVVEKVTMDAIAKDAELLWWRERERERERESS